MRDALRWLSHMIRGRKDNAMILSKKDIKKRRFKGWDWTELAEMWDLYENKKSPDDVAEEDLEQAIRDHVLNSWAYRGGVMRLAPQVKADLDSFLIAVIEGEAGYLYPVYQGILKVEEESEYVKAYMAFLKFMWT